MKGKDFEISAGGSSVMRTRIWFMLLLGVLVLTSATGVAAQTPAPAIFFTDLTSGPNSGGESVSGFSGAYVSIYGNNFGATQGTSTVTLNGSNCLRIVSWGTPWLWYQKIVVQLGSSCTSGRFSITVGGQASAEATITINGAVVHPAAFTVRAGNIRCVSTAGNDNNPGTFAGGCWASISKAAHTIGAGDIAYIGNGVSSNTQDPSAPYNAEISFLSGGSPGNEIALVAYPGATVNLGPSQSYCIRTPNVNGPGPYLVVAGFTCSGDFGLAFNVGNVRVIANTITCPGGDGSSACSEMSGPFNVYYGDTIDTAGIVGASKTYHGLYFSDGHNHTDVGWNVVSNVRGCRGIQMHNDNADFSDIHVHDNLIHDTVCDGINFSTVNANNGPVEAFNNVLYLTGKGPGPPDGSSVYTCFRVGSKETPTVPVQIYNNTCFNAGSNGDTTTAGSVQAEVPTLLRNNILYQTNGFPYLTTSSGCANISPGSNNNDFFGNGPAPNCSGMSGSLNVDPKVVNTSTRDFHLQSGSPLIDSGVTITTLNRDHDGVTRPQGAGYDTGAYEFFSGGSTVQRPNPPTNLTVVVQ